MPPLSFSLSSFFLFYYLPFFLYSLHVYPYHFPFLLLLTCNPPCLLYSNLPLSLSPSSAPLLPLFFFFLNLQSSYYQIFFSLFPFLSFQFSIYLPYFLFYLYPILVLLLFSFLSLSFHLYFPPDPSSFLQFLYLFF